MARKGHTRDHYGDVNILYLDYISVSTGIPRRYCRFGARPPQ